MYDNIAEWIRRSCAIKAQLIIAMRSRLIYWKTSEIVLANPQLPQHSLVYFWMTASYADSVIISIRR